ncbi:MAG TPA: glycosyltransferase family 39 protein [Candidatus Tectomicrobia bacterium]
MHRSTLPSRLARLSRLAGWIPGLLYAGLCLWFWHSGGVRYGGDSSRYIEAAERVVGGQPLTGPENAFPAYILLLAAVRSVSLNDSTVVLLQVLAGGLAVTATYDLGRRMAGRFAGLVAGTLYVMQFEIAWFAFLILTDSLYTSGLVLTTYATYRSIDPNSSPRWGAIVPPLALALALIRTQGWIALPIFLILLLVGTVRRSERTRALMPLASSLVAAALLWAALESGLISENPLSAARHLSDPYTSVLAGTVIWGDPTSNMSMPVSDIQQAERATSISGYCMQQGVACAGLFMRRILVALARVRPYFSPLHNAAIALSTPFLYGLAVNGIVTRRREMFTWGILAIIVAHIAFIGAIWIDWDGRFLLYVLPLMALYGGVGAEAMLRRFRPGSKEIAT